MLKEQVKDEVKQNIEEAKQNLKQATIGRVETMTRKAAKRVEAGQVSLMERIRENPAP
ncbi:MAG: hypothetical protein MUF21_04510 [Gemmatimonadaceae bacterium]|nr:hypothetical protein [Gemmatimonadaceae bacterium]MCU0625739.1 hypothetical protein [Gemmatimonadaceae bacterium]